MQCVVLTPRVMLVSLMTHTEFNAPALSIATWRRNDSRHSAWLERCGWVAWIDVSGLSKRIVIQHLIGCLLENGTLLHKKKKLKYTEQLKQM